jgi:3-oxoacyl-[acyl-carrier protein] reductase
MAMQRRFEGRTAIITGAARGIGLAIARRFLEEGAAVILSDIDSTGLSKAIGGLGHLSERAAAIACDVAREESVNRLVNETVERFGGVDILVNNAGISPKHEGRKTPVAETSAAEWQRVLDVNLSGAFLCSRACLAPMRRRRWGRIVNIASMAGRTKAEIAGAHYAASKAGMMGLARTLAAEVGRDGITVNCIAPGRIVTPMAEEVPAEVNQAALARIPVGRLGTPEDVAAAVAFLASEQAGFISGVTLDVNGGAFMA